LHEFDDFGKPLDEFLDRRSKFSGPRNAVESLSFARANRRELGRQQEQRRDGDRRFRGVFAFGARRGLDLEKGEKEDLAGKNFSIAAKRSKPVRST
jgi:hypothetical protein